jgi:hypothetical protein
MAAESSFSTDDSHPYRINMAVFVNIPKESPKLVFGRWGECEKQALACAKTVRDLALVRVG